MPVISNLVYTVTDSTIVATWTTDVSADSNLSAGGKAAIDNGVAASSTSHQCIVTGLLPSTIYSCVVTSGGTSSTPQSIPTNAAQNRIPILSGSLGPSTMTTVHGDINFTFLSNDNKMYITEDDGFGFVPNTPNAGANMQIGVITNETAGGFAGSLVNLLTAYLGSNQPNGADGPAGAACSNKVSGIFGMLGNLYLFALRQSGNGGGYYNNVIKSTDKGATWNNYQSPASFNAAGSPINTATFPLPNKTYGWVNPVLYGADDGTLGYNTAGNQIDGANGYVYQTFTVSAFTAGGDQGSPVYLLRIPRIQFDAQSTTSYQFWVGPASPAVADFVNDANWSASDASKTAIINPTPRVFATFVTFIPAVNYYILQSDANSTPDSTHNTTYFFAGPTPAGPWTQFFSQITSTMSYGFMPMHRDVVTNSATNNINIRVISSGAANSFTTFYFPTIQTLTLKTTSTVNTFKQSNASTTAFTGATQTLGFPGSVALGDLLVVGLRHGSPPQTITSVTDDMGVGNNWVIVYDTVMPGTNQPNAGWAYAFSNGSGTCNVSVTKAASDPGGVMVIGDWSGPTSARATPAGVGSTTATTLTSASATAVAGDLIVGIFAINSGTASVTPGAGFTIRASGTSGGTTFGFLQDNLNASAGAQTASATVTGVQNGAMTGIGIFASPQGPTGGGGGAGMTGDMLIPNRYCSRMWP